LAEVLQKFEPQHLEQLTVPDAILEDDLVREQLSDACRLILRAAAIGDTKTREQHVIEVDQIIATSVGISLDELQS
jgi:hypothetical protein